MFLNKMKEYIYFHWQNLNELPNDELGFPWNGRVWLSSCKTDKSINFEWNLKSWFCGSRLSVDNMEDEIQWHLAIPPVSLWFGLEGFFNIIEILGLDEKREIGFSIHGWKLWCKIWGKSWSWNRNDPWWQDFNVELNPITIVFGDTEYHSQVIKEEVVNVPMPEGIYKAKMKLCYDTWSRKRWPTLKKGIMRVHCDMENPIPKPGKGTESWNCDQDALHGWSGPAKSFEEAVGHIVSSVLTDRKRYPL